MKRVLICVLALVMGLLAVGCRPQGMDQQTYDIGRRALRVTDEFLDGNITAQLALSSIRELGERIDSFESEGSSESTGSAEWYRNRVRNLTFLVGGEFSQIVRGGEF